MDTTHEYKFNLADLSQKEAPTVEDIPALLDVIDAFCSEVIELYAMTGSGIEYTAIQIIQVIEQYRATSAIE